MVFICKKCKKAFRKDVNEYDESDEYCPHCDNHYVSCVSPRIVHSICALLSDEFSPGHRCKDAAGCADCRRRRCASRFQVCVFHDDGLLIYSIFEGCSKTTERRTARVDPSSVLKIPRPVWDDAGASCIDTNCQSTCLSHANTCHTSASLNMLLE